MTARGAKRKKQAVILIHGIGEQRPMQTLRGFVRTVWETDDAVRAAKTPATAWSKPDKISGSFELRRLTTGQSRNRVSTDFFEFYWAHLMRDNALSHVLAWVRVLLLRSPATVPRHLLPLWWLLVLLVVGGASLFVWATLAGDESLLSPGPGVTALLSFVLSVTIGAFVVNAVGDAARYLHVSPKNIESRAAIRQAGVDLLRTLHDRGGYDRIIIVGHSLGSVIAYDILTHAWPEFNMRHDGALRPSRPATEAMEVHLAAALDSEGRPLDASALERGVEPFDPTTFRQQQAACSRDLRGTGCDWLVTDLVTLGSPLAHAATLLATDLDDLRDRIGRRELPSCPPMLESLHRRPALKHRRFTFRLKYTLPSGRGRSVRAPHHAAVFAATRWTNLYFRRRWLFWGDFVGGPIAPVFGPGVKDVPVQTSMRGGFFTHTCYWKQPTTQKNDGTAAPHIAELRKAVNLLDAPERDPDGVEHESPDSSRNSSHDSAQRG